MSGSQGSRPPAGLDSLVLAASALLDPEALARVAADHVRATLQCDGAVLSWWDDRQGALVPLAFDDPRKRGPDPVFHLGQGLVGAVFADGVPRLTDDYAAEVDRPMAWTDIRSGIAVPLAAPGEPAQGVLCGFHYDRAHFNRDQFEVLGLIAAQVTPTLATMKVLAAAQRRTAEARALAGVMRAAAASPELETVVGVIGEYATRLLGADLAGLVLRPAVDGRSAWHGVYGNRTDGWRDRYYGTSHGASPVIFGGRTRLVHAAPGEATIDPESYPFFSSEGVLTGLSLPLRSGPRVIGALVLGWRFMLQPAPAHIELGETFADFASTLVDRALAEHERALLIANAPVVLAAIDGDGLISVCEGAAAEQVGLGANVVGLRFTDALSDAPALIAFLQSASRAEPVSTAVTFRERDFDVRTLPQGYGGYLVATDVTERVRLAREIEHQATHDELTGLPNRPLVISSIAVAVAESGVSVVAADIRAFDAVNETVGNDAGDELLQLLGRRLALDIPDAVVIGRTGGDEFTVAFRHGDGVDPVAQAERVGASLGAPVEVGGRQSTLEVRCGVAWSAAGEDARSVLRRADSALQVARRGAGAIVVHDADMAARHRRQLELTADLRDALAEGTIDAWFQPIVELDGGGLLALEALARWRHPQHGWVSPATFVELAERSGLIGSLTEQMIGHALRCAAALGVPVAVNVSGVDLVDSALAATLERLLAAHEAGPELLTIEITESFRLEEDPGAIAVLERIDALGVRIAIDDFGTGWSSMTLLQRLPAQVLKLDRTYVGRMSVDTGSRAVVSACITLARALGLRIVAEGIEDEATRMALIELGCEHGQGFHFAAPMPREQLQAWRAGCGH